MPSPEQSPKENTAPTFLVDQYELHIATYRVISESAAGAIAKVLAGEAELPENSTEFVDVCEDFGMPIEGNEAIAKELEEMNVVEAPVVIPSIRSVQVAQ